MGYDEFVERFKKEFEYVSKEFGEPTDNELVNLFISGVVMFKFQSEEIDRIVKEENRRLRHQDW